VETIAPKLGSELGDGNRGGGASYLVIPAKVGTHLLPTRYLVSSRPETDNMDSRFRGNDDGQMDSRFRGNDGGQMPIHATAPSPI